MSIAHLLTQLVTVRHFTAGAKDTYGNETPTWDAGALYHGRLEPADSREVTVGRDTQISDWRLFLDAGAVIGGRDIVVDEDGRTFEVLGPPAVERTPAGPHHIEARLRYVEG